MSMSASEQLAESAQAGVRRRFTCQWQLAKIRDDHLNSIHWPPTIDQPPPDAHASLKRFERLSGDVHSCHQVLSM
jgi:hypothetical protein